MPPSFVKATSLDGRGPSVGADYVVAGHVKLRAEVLRVGQGDLPVREGAGIGPPRMTCQSPSCEIRRMDASASPNSTPATLRRHAAGSLLGSPPAARHMSVRLSISARSRVARTDASLASGGISMDARITKVANRFPFRIRRRRRRPQRRRGRSSKAPRSGLLHLREHPA